jgi:hypothetical protein
MSMSGIIPGQGMFPTVSAVHGNPLRRPYKAEVGGSSPSTPTAIGIQALSGLSALSREVNSIRGAHILI